MLRVVKEDGSQIFEKKLTAAFDLGRRTGVLYRLLPETEEVVVNLEVEGRGWGLTSVDARHSAISWTGLKLFNVTSSMHQKQ